LSRNKLYILLAVACLIGYSWLFFNYRSGAETDPDGLGVCIFKEVTHIPCPSCGSTRSAISLLHGNIADALYWNPIGFLLGIIWVIVPLWLIFDVVLKKDSFFRLYKRSEATLEQKKVAVPLIILVLANWIWNIFKSL
jgi:hypothetical protein